MITQILFKQKYQIQRPSQIIKMESQFQNQNCLNPLKSEFQKKNQIHHNTYFSIGSLDDQKIRDTADKSKFSHPQTYNSDNQHFNFHERQKMTSSSYEFQDDKLKVDHLQHLFMSYSQPLQSYPHLQTKPNQEKRHTENQYSHLFHQSIDSLNQKNTSKKQEDYKKQIQDHKQNIHQMKQRKSQKRKQIQKLHEQQRQRLQKLKQQNRRFLQDKKQKDKQIQKYKKKIQSLKKNKQKQVDMKKQKQLMHEIEEFRKNQQKYFQAIKLQKQELKKQMNRRKQQQIKKQQQQVRKVNQLKKSKHLSTRYLQQKRKEQEQRKKKQQQDQRKVEQIRSFLSRRNSYQDKLKNLEQQLMKQKSKPIKQKSETQIRSEQRRLNTKSLSAAQIYKMGQQYMEEVHSNLDPFAIKQTKMQIQSNNNSLRQSTRSEYKDYLKESKLKRQVFFKSTGKIHANPEIRELRKIIIKEENSPQKLLRAKLLTYRLDQKVSNKPSIKLKADSIAAKLKIIQEFI